MTGIYVASRKRNANMLRWRRDCGVPIISSWIDAVDTGRIPKPTQSEIWRNAFEEIGRCTAFVFYDGGDFALVEFGIALGMGVPTLAVVEYGDYLSTLPCVVFYTTLDAALAHAANHGEMTLTSTTGVRK